jgi:sugar phosphate isomerase/epimerase
MRTKMFLIFVSFAFTNGSYAQVSDGKNDLLFSRDNLVAWCIIPYDSKKRNSEERALMLKELGIGSFAYDWRNNDLPMMETELATMKKHGIKVVSAWLFVNEVPGKILDDADETVLQTIRKTNTKTELWVSFPNSFFDKLTDEEKVAKGAKMITYLHQRASEMGCTIALYNHEDWFGEPANEVKIIEATGLKDIHIVYNFHHGHTQMDQFEKILAITKPYLTTVNINGMKAGGPQIIPVGSGDREGGLLKMLKASGYNGSIGIIGHTEGEDVKEVLQRNIEGLKKILAEIGDQKALATYN